MLFRMVKVLLLHVLLCASFFAAQAADEIIAAGNSCDRLFTLTGKELAEIKQSFSAKHNSNYTYEVAATPIRDQCNYGSCWVHGTLAEIEHHLLKKTGKAVDLSEEYVVTYSLLERAYIALANPGFHVDEGGWLQR